MPRTASGWILILAASFSSIQFYDELSQQESSVDGETEDLPQPVSMVTKVLQLSGLSVEFDYTHLTNVNLREEQDPLRGKGEIPQGCKGEIPQG